MADYKSQDIVATREILERYPDSKWGFVIYRCTYDDDDNEMGLEGNIPSGHAMAHVPHATDPSNIHVVVSHASN
ncbi:hypothetical protein BU23DRAFT_550708 [Bimuria novae-zelandiae CBS 107.79]|uniref:Uncharacterized protein n=1 Tax=Bimuria novae-zelandiae CBS 107.79 TaxID=1447943 RepID=A0A6A5VL29_9PLEO|nr:hypothetical protein BU23DRAFT_550708 [Bimuria novae-zelandiae CBS 107.79]